MTGGALGADALSAPAPAASTLVPPNAETARPDRRLIAGTVTPTTLIHRP